MASPRLNMQGKLRPRLQQTLRLRWLLRGVGGGLLLLASLWAVRTYQLDRPEMPRERWQQVRLTPLAVSPQLQVSSSTARRAYEGTLTRQRQQKALDPTLTRQALEKQALLHELEDLELRLALHRDDPAFDPAPLLTRRARLQEQVRPPTLLPAQP